MLEVEVKVQVERLSDLRHRLESQGATKVMEVVEEDLYLQHPSRDFAATDEALRVRRTSYGEPTITYKGPRLPSRAKAREELSLAVDRAENALRLFERLGFRVAGHVKKTREVWRLPGATVCLDQVEGLGAFVEVEAARSDTVGAAEEEALKVLGSLGLADQPLIRKSYLELLRR